MHVEYHNFYAYRLDRMMEFKIYGHAGKPLVVFPSSGGRFHEFEDFGMIDAISGLINEGVVQVYALDSIDKETWLAMGRSADDKAMHHNAYDRYVIEEMVPYIRERNAYWGNLALTGCSLGAFHAANFYFRHPDVFDTLIALSGIYDVRFMVGDHLTSSDVYFNSPLDYLPNLSDPHYLDRYRQGHLIFSAGQGRWESESLRDMDRLSAILADKGVDAWFDRWGHDVDHDWPWWRQMLPYYLGILKDQNIL
jgi:esterase/lipase superfamily enzyme